MSRPAKAAQAAAPAADPPKPPPPPTCAACRHWRPAGDHRGHAAGRCVESPPGVPAEATAHGPRCLYPVTLASDPACGRFSREV